MATLVRTAKGKVIDMNQLFVDNQKSVALGNAHMNARGDLLKNGKVIKTVEEQRKEYEESNVIVKTKVPLSNTSADKLEEIFKQEVEEMKPTSKIPVKETVQEPVEQKMQEAVKETPVKKITKKAKKVEGLSLTDILNKQ